MVGKTRNSFRVGSGESNPKPSEYEPWIIATWPRLSVSILVERIEFISKARHSSDRHRVMGQCHALRIVNSTRCYLRRCQHLHDEKLRPTICNNSSYRGGVCCEHNYLKARAITWMHVTPRAWDCLFMKRAKFLPTSCSMMYTELLFQSPSQWVLGGGAAPPPPPQEATCLPFVLNSCQQTTFRQKEQEWTHCFCKAA
jgi:hypothetical protein